MNIFLEKIKEVTLSVFPITLIVIVLNFTISPMTENMLIRFLLGAICIIVGLAVFLIGVDLGITPIGNLMGSALTRSGKLGVVLVAGLLLGFFISVAEPDLHILAEQIDSVTDGVISKLYIVVVVSIGIAVMLSAGLWRIMKGIALPKMLLVLYTIIFALSLLSSEEFLAVSFDASGATTGAMTVPFIMALAIGVSSMRKDSISSEKDSFGLVAIASTGAIISVMVMGIVFKMDDLTGSLDINTATEVSIIQHFKEELSIVSTEAIYAVAPILIIFLISNQLIFKKNKKQIKRICVGVFYNWLGLTLFLTGVNAGFLDAGKYIGHYIAGNYSTWSVVAIGFMLGLLTILAEPAVHVLTQQVEMVTAGYVKRKHVLVALSIGVGCAVALSVLRIVVPGLLLWHYLLPGYIIAIVIMRFVPKLFVGIAFDSGGVASGPMTATFILSFSQGIAECIEGADVLIEGFGVISMVALTPIITIQVLGLLFRIKNRRGDNESI